MAEPSEVAEAAPEGPPTPQSVVDRLPSVPDPGEPASPTVAPFARWRWWLLILAWVAPLVGYLIFRTTSPVPAFRWDPLQPREVAARYEEALSSLNMGNLPGAEQQLVGLRDENPLNPLVNALLGQVLRQQGRREEAMAATRLALERDPTLGEAWYNLACDQQALGRTDDAFRSLQSAQAHGVDVRRLLPQDSTLKPLLPDPRIQVFLAGASMIPSQEHSAWLSVSPRNPEPGQAVQVTLELVGIAGQVQPEAPLPMTLAWRGAAAFQVLKPLNATLSHARGQVGARPWERWTLVATLQAVKAGTERLGPWEVQLEGVAVPLPSQTVVVLPVRVGEAPTPLLAGSTREPVAGTSGSSGGAVAAPPGEPSGRSPSEIAPAPPSPGTVFNIDGAHPPPTQRAW